MSEHSSKRRAAVHALRWIHVLCGRNSGEARVTTAECGQGGGRGEDCRTAGMGWYQLMGHLADNFTDSELCSERNRALSGDGFRNVI
jgi:hypothetical protein